MTEEIHLVTHINGLRASKLLGQQLKGGKKALRRIIEFLSQDHKNDCILPD